MSELPKLSVNADPPAWLAKELAPPTSSTSADSSLQISRLTPQEAFSLAMKVKLDAGTG